MLEDQWDLKVNEFIIIIFFVDKPKNPIDNVIQNNELRRSSRLLSMEISQIANQDNHVQTSERIDKNLKKSLRSKKIKKKGGRPKGSLKRSRPLTVDGERRKKRAISRKSYAKRKIDMQNEGTNSTLQNDVLQIAEINKVEKQVTKDKQEGILKIFFNIIFKILKIMIMMELKKEKEDQKGQQDVVDL